MAREAAIVPKAFYKLLDHTTASLFLRDPYMRGFVVKTYSVGIQRIGRLVQLDEEQVFRLAPTSANNRRRIRQELTAAGLGFGMLAPGWKDPDDTRGRANGKAHSKRREGPL